MAVIGGAFVVPAAAREGATHPQVTVQAAVVATRGVGMTEGGTEGAKPGRGAKSKDFYWPELDVLRFVAFCMVWCAHVALSFRGCLPEGAVVMAQGVGSFGVPLFFFLSAFLITERMRRERDGFGTVNLTAFYVRRVLRIWPLYLGVLGCYAVLGLFFHGFRIEPGRLLASCLLFGNWYLIAHPALTSPMRALWSVSVEEQWYMLWPFLFAHFASRRLIAICAGIVGVSVLTLWVLSSGWQRAPLSVTAWDNSLVQFQYFACGAATALVLKGRLPQFDSSARLMLVIGAFCLLGLAAGPCAIKQAEAGHSPGGLVTGYLLAGAGAGGLFLAALGCGAVGMLRPVVYLGRISFGLYVFHETGFFLADALRRALLHGSADRHVVLNLCAEKTVALGIAIALASLSYRYWELPFLRLKRRWATVQKGAAA